MRDPRNDPSAVMEPLLRIADVHKRFRTRGRAEYVHAVKGVNLEVRSGQSIAVIGESGSGKSTLGRLAVGLQLPDSGSVTIAGSDLQQLTRRRLRSMRSEFSVVFQEPAQSLNPRMKIGDIVGEPLVVHEPSITAEERRTRMLEALADVDLPPEMSTRYPSSLSGGQQQRVGIARAIISRPRLVVLDEPTSSLDSSIRAGILRLLSRLRERNNLAYLLISHDIASVRNMSEYVAVMYLGEIVEYGPTSSVLDDPQHLYTKTLLSAELSIDPSVAPKPLQIYRP